MSNQLDEFDLDVRFLGFPQGQPLRLEGDNERRTEERSCVPEDCPTSPDTCDGLAPTCNTCEQSCGGTCEDTCGQQATCPAHTCGMDCITDTCPEATCGCNTSETCNHQACETAITFPAEDCEDQTDDTCACPPDPSKECPDDPD